MAFLGNLVQSPLAFFDKVAELQTIEGEVATNREFGKRHQVGALSLGFQGRVYDFFRVLLKIANAIVELCQCNFHILFDFL